MIMADRVRYYTTLSTHDIAAILRHSGYPGHSFEHARFEGITNSGAFCYVVDYWDDTVSSTELQHARVYIEHDAGTNTATAEF